MIRTDFGCTNNEQQCCARTRGPVLRSMDVISYLGYRGDELIFLDHERYSFVSGRGLCINDAHGPADIIWRGEGISCYTSHVARGWVAFAPMSTGTPIEVIDSQERELVKSFDNPVGADIIDMSFSRSGSKLYAIMGYDQKLLWDLIPRNWC